MKEKILTHKAPRHADETLAVLLLMDKYPDADILTVHPQKKIKEHLATSKSIVVDVGGDFNPKLRNYDHHQDTMLPCSLVQVLVHEVKDVLRKINHTGKGGEFLAVIDTIDRFGFFRASKEFGIRKSASCSVSQTLFLEMADKIMNEKVKIWDVPFREVFVNSILMEDKGFCKELVDALKIVGYFVEQEYDESPYLYFFKNAIGMLNERGKELLLETARKLKEEEKRNYAVVNKSVLINHLNLLTVVISKETAPARMFFAKHKEADILIVPNRFSPKSETSIVKNMQKKTAREINLREIYKEVFSPQDELFTHQTGFITVVKENINEVLDRLFEICDVLCFCHLQKTFLQKDKNQFTFFS